MTARSSSIAAPGPIVGGPPPARLGPRVTRAGLAGAAFIGFDRTDGFRKGLAAMVGLTLAPSNFPLVCASQHVQWALVPAGAGIGVMLADVGDAEPGVCRVLDELPPITVPRWLVSHQDVRTSRRLRVVADALALALDRPPRARGSDARRGPVRPGP